jgi:membrane-associated phospholipid phosphatase
VAFAYFAVLAVAAALRPLPFARRVSNGIISAGMCAAIVFVARDASPFGRDWSPLFVILVGYYLSGRFFIEASLPFEEWLLAWDRRLFGDPPARFARWPRPVIVGLEAVYMLTFAVLPAGCAVLYLSGQRAAVNRYWTMVTAAEFGAFAPLAFVQTRPPWALEPGRQRDAASFRRLGLFWVRHTSHCANTFPSGHAAGSLAVAFGVLTAVPAAGAAFLAVALAIAVASVVGRYHYFVDVITGALLAVVVVAVVLLLRI